MHSISDLTTYCRKTTGDVPAKLVGASTTVVGSKMYLFGGRLVAERRMVADLYVFDLEQCRWEMIEPFPEDDLPSARYFHSADTWNNQLIVFGGMGNKIGSPNAEDLRVLNDVRFFDITTRHWLPFASTNSTLDPVSESLVPKARYAHLSSVTANRLFIIGGQDLANVWLDDIYVYDLVGKVWVQRRDYPRHCGTYRSVAVSADTCVRLPQDELRASQSPSKLGGSSASFRSNKSSPTKSHHTTSDSLVHLPYSTEPSEEYPSDIYLYSNYNFTDVKRELEVFSPLPDRDFTIHDRSSSMGGASLPPGLRFPTGAILGTHFIIAGTYLAHTYQSFSIWVLNLLSMTWSRIDPGSAVSLGSWFRGCLWADSNKFLIFGNRNGNLVDDYNRRLLSWDHVAVVDLEAFGIYKVPQLELEIPMQELGLAALEEDILTDFEIVCDDGRKVRCSRKLLEDRWPWFRDQRIKFLEKAKLSLVALPKSSNHTPAIDLPEQLGDQVDPRLTPRSFQLSEPYPITLALLQYFYSLALITPLQHAPAVLSQLLVLSNTYQLKHLESLVKHAMHRALSNSTSVGVYEVATLCGCRSLQIRALKTVMSYSQKRPMSRPRRDTDDGGGSSGPGGGGGSRGYSSGGGQNPPTARPRGTSDAVLRGPHNTQNFPGSSRGFAMNAGGSNINRETNGLSTISETSSAPASHISSPPSTSQTRSGRDSVISLDTETDIRSVAELFSTAVVDKPNYIAEEHEVNVDAIDDEDEIVIAPLHRLHVDPPDNISRDESYLDTDSTHLSPSQSSKVNSFYSDSDAECWSDDQPDRGLHPNGIVYPSLRMAARRPHRNYTNDGSDTPSLISSNSYSSLASASGSNAPLESPVSFPVSFMVPPYITAVDERHPGAHITDPHEVDPSGSITALEYTQMHNSDPPGAIPGKRVFLGRTSPTATVETVTARPSFDSESVSSDKPQQDSRSRIEPRFFKPPPPPSSPSWDGSTTDSMYSNTGHTSISGSSTETTAPSSQSSRSGVGRLGRFKLMGAKVPKDESPVQTLATEKYWETELPFNKEARKAEEKRRRHAVARVKNERLAEDLKLRQETRAAAEKALLAEKQAAKKQMLKTRRTEIPMLFG